MPEQVRFYRGNQGVSLPENQPGGIFIMQRTDTLGDMYVDIDENTRLHITPDKQFITVSQVDAPTISAQTSEVNKVYYFVNNGNPYIKIGNGLDEVGALPSYSLITATEKNLWQNNLIDISTINLGNNEYNINFSKINV